MTIRSKAQRDIDMNEEIIKSIEYKLSEIEEKENVMILHCVESGSRAWGFPSPDSDYDVRFIYVRRREDYLKLRNIRDVIEWQLDDTLDINGWDLQKTLRLLYKSNPTVFEWNSSPIVYRTTAEWASLNDTIGHFFDPKAGMYHYLNTAKSTAKAHLTKDKVKLKKYFYVLRPLLAADWIRERKTPPPMLFSELIKTQLDGSLVCEVNRLLEKKLVTSELGEGEHIKEIDEYIEKIFAKLSDEAKALPAFSAPDIEVLDRVFINLLF